MKRIEYRTTDPYNREWLYVAEQEDLNGNQEQTAEWHWTVYNEQVGVCWQSVVGLDVPAGSYPNHGEILAAWLCELQQVAILSLPTDHGLQPPHRVDGSDLEIRLEGGGALVVLDGVSEPDGRRRSTSFWLDNEQRRDLFTYLSQPE